MKFDAGTKPLTSFDAPSPSLAHHRPIPPPSPPLRFCCGALAGAVLSNGSRWHVLGTYAAGDEVLHARYLYQIRHVQRHLPNQSLCSI